MTSIGDLPESFLSLMPGFEKSDDHVVITDREGVILYANKAAEEHTGYSRKEMLGRKPGELWGGHMSPEFYEDMWETISIHRQAYVGEMRNKRKDGSYYWQEVHIIPVMDEQDETQFFIGIELNVDEQERKEKLIQDCVREKAIGRDLRVLWPLGWLLEKGHLTKEQLVQLQSHYAKENALDSLTNDLLAISNVLFANKQPEEDFCALELLQEVVREVQEKFPERHYNLNYKGEKFVVHENKKLLFEVLERIIVNAAQYTHTSVGEVLLVLLRTGSHCVVRVQDNGIGISFNDQKRMFNKFYRGGKSRNMNPYGSGLGLYLVKTIADVRGWTISCISEPEKGTCFEVKVPLKAKVEKRELAGVA